MGTWQGSAKSQKTCHGFLSFSGTRRYHFYFFVKKKRVFCRFVAWEVIRLKYRILLSLVHMHYRFQNGFNKNLCLIVGICIFIGLFLLDYRTIITYIFIFTRKPMQLLFTITLNTKFWAKWYTFHTCSFESHAKEDSFLRVVLNNFNYYF